MAYDFGMGLGSGLQGATAGAMVGGPWGAAIGGGLGLLGGFTSDATTEQINPYADQYWDLLNANMTNYNRQMTGELGRQSDYLGGAENYYRQMADFTPTARFDPAAATRMTMSQNPMLQNMARESLGDFTDAETMQRSIQRAATSAAAQFNSMNALGSGAAAGAVGQAAGDVAGQYNMQQSQLYQNAYLQMLANQQRMNMAGVEGQYGAAAARDQMRFGGLSGAAQGYGNIASQYGNRASMYGQLAGQAQASMGQVANPEFVYTPPEQLFDAGGTLMGIAGLDYAMRGPEGEGSGLVDSVRGWFNQPEATSFAPSTYQARPAPAPWTTMYNPAPDPYAAGGTLNPVLNPMMSYQPPRNSWDYRTGPAPTGGGFNWIPSW